MLTSIKIEKLFDIFDYDIEFKKEGITILTGPNGYGKTTILKILDALDSQNGFFFLRLQFKKIVLNFSDRDTITLEKKEKKSIWINGSDAHWNIKSLDKMLRGIPFFRQFDGKTWMDERTGELYEKEDLFQKVISDFPKLASNVDFGRTDIDIGRISQFLKSPFPRVYFISSQRLLRPISYTKSNRHREFLEKEVNTFSNTIEEYAKELCNNIRDVLAKSSQTAQILDSSFPRRLFEQTYNISESDFNQRFEKIKDIQKSLSQYGLSDIEEDNHPTYKEENAKALSVYIDDTEKKLAIFSELLEKLRTFIDILNERRFTFKKIAISKEDGFKFTTDNGLPLELGDLSSGEQQEVVLLYELLFKVKEGTLVLIDEPELSLHVVWQKQFLDDLFKIIELQKIDIVVATHSPQIINNRWDLEVDLEVLHNASASK
jgi:predicted ATP-binding protein involved in virulence